MADAMSYMKGCPTGGQIAAAIYAASSTAWTMWYLPLLTSRLNACHSVASSAILRQENPTGTRFNRNGLAHRMILTRGIDTLRPTGNARISTYAPSSLSACAT